MGICLILRFFGGEGGGGWGAGSAKKDAIQLYTTHMYVYFKRDVVDVCALMFPVLGFPDEIRALVLTYSGHLRIGSKSLSYTIFY